MLAPAQIQRLLVLAVCVITLGALGSTGCIPSYASDDPLPFDQFDYSSVDGEEWPVYEIELPELVELHGMRQAPTLRYVELNPDGERTVVFLHGLGSYLKFWRYQLDHFAEQGYRVIALDMLGYGKSDKPASFPYTMEAMGDVVWQVLDKKNISKPILVGHSMGGQTALSFAIRFPGRARGLVLVAPAGFEKFSWTEEQWFRNAYTTRLIKASDEEAIWNSVRRYNFYRWRSEYNWLVEERVRVRDTPEFDSYAYASVKSVAGLSNNDFVRGNLEKIEVPTLIVHGDKDRLIPNAFLHGGFTRNVMEYGAEQIPQAKLVTLEDCGHTLQIDCHDRFNKLALSYFSENFPEPPASR